MEVHSVSLSLSLCYLESSRYVTIHRTIEFEIGQKSGSDLKATATLRFFEEVRMSVGSLFIAKRNTKETKYQSRVAALRDRAKRPKIVLKLDQIN